MSTDFVTPGFVDIGFVDGASTPSPGIQQWTDFREYPRGRYPGDWTQRTGLLDISSSRIEATHFENQHKNKFLIANTVTSVPLHTWNVIDNDPDKADQQMFGIVRKLGTGDPTHRLFMRASYDPSLYVDPNGYAFLLTPGEILIYKVVNDVATLIGTVAKSLDNYGWVKFVCECTGSTIRAKKWSANDVEPVAWDISIVDATYTTGWLGVREGVDATSFSEYKFFSVGTAGLLAPRDTVLTDSPPLESWIRDENEPLDLIARLNYFNPDTSLVEDLYVSRTYRETGPLDYPPSTKIYPYLIDPGTLSTGLDGDSYLSGSSSVRLTPLRLRNEVVSPNSPGLLDDFPRLSFYGRPIEYLLGRKYETKPNVSNPSGILTELRRYERIGSGVISQEPETTSNEALFNLGPSDILLNKELPRYNNVGIPTCVKSLSASGYLSIPSHTSYDITSFCIYLRVYIPVAGLVGTSAKLSNRVDSSLGEKRQWSISANGTNLGPLSVHKINISVHKSDGTNLFPFLQTFKRYNLGRFIDIILGVNGSDRWYAYIDGSKVGSGLLTANPFVATGQIVECSRFATGLFIVDHRIERFVSESEALSRFSSRKDPDPINISMHRFDDNTGSTVTDYNTTTANHGTLQGTDGVDRSWQPSYLGSVEVAGTLMPISGGVIYNAPVQHIDSVREIVRFNDRAKTTGSTLQIRAKGVQLTSGANYSEPAEGPGTADIVGASDQPVTFGLTNSAPDDERLHVPRLVADEIINRGGMTNGEFDFLSMYGLRRLLPFKGGFSYPSKVSLKQFILDGLGGLGGYHSLDNSGRIYGGCLLPPINPGPFGQDVCLEFMGYGGNGVSIKSPLYNLSNNTTRHTISLIFKLNRTPIDPSTSSSFTHFPNGMTLLDMTSGTSGYYLGIDGRDGKLIWGHPGVTKSGLHYTKNPQPLSPGIWYWVIAGLYQDFSIRNIHIGTIGHPIILDVGSDVVLTGSFTPAPNTMTLKIGHGVRGPFHGSIMYVRGLAGSSINDFELINGIRPVYSSGENYWLELRDGINGIGDYVTDKVTGSTGYVDGCRWCPRLTMDFRSVAGPMLPSSRRPIPAWKAETQYKQNLNPLTGTDVAGSVSAADRIALQTPYLSEPVTDEDVRLNYKDSREFLSKSMLSNQTDADFISFLNSMRVSTDRRFSTANDWFREILRLSLTDEVLVISNRFGYENGRSMRIHELTKRLNDLRGEAALWG